ncbi:MAG TPA: TonB-dependent receptor [Bacteroidia bacterium]|nr:TonB-dependent receptor [Bacteroidia bacterium]
MSLRSLTYILVVITLHLISASLSYSQSPLNGRVLDEANEKPISGVVVHIAETYMNTVTDKDGRFSFSEIKNKNKLRLIFSHLSYEKDTLEVLIPSNELVVKLRIYTYLSPEISISATRVGIETGFAHKNLSHQDIGENNVGQDIPYLLQLTPSMVSTSDAGTGVGYSGMRIRGSDASRINVTINGIPVNDAESHQVYWVNLPDLASSIEDVQIQRGVGTSTNGAGAFGGSVNIQTLSLRKNPYASLSSSAGSFNTFKNSIGFGSGLLSDHFTIDGNISMIKSDGYIDRASADLKSAFLTGSYYGESSSIRAIILTGKEKTYHAWNGVPEDSLKNNRRFNPAGLYYDQNGDIKYYEEQTDNYQQDNYQLHFSQIINKRLNVNLAFHGTLGEGYYEEYSQGDAYSKYGMSDAINGFDTIQYSDFIRQKWLKNDFYGLTASGIYTQNKYKVTLGAAANKYSGDHFGKVIWTKDRAINTFPHEYYSNEAEKEEFTVYAKFEAKLFPRLNSFFDLQLRNIGYNFAGPDIGGNILPQHVDYSFFNPKLGLSYTLNEEQRIYASAGIGQKEPVRDDFISSSTLSRPLPEKLIDYELGYELELAKIRLVLNAYFMDYHNQLILNGKINDVGEYTRQNVDKSYRRGLELELYYLIIPKLKFEGNLTISKNKIKVFEEYIDDYDTETQILRRFNSTNIAFSPTLIGAGMITWNPVQPLSISFTGKYVGQQFLDNTENPERKIEAYLINDLKLQYKLSLKPMRELALKIQVNNIFDKEYSSNGYTYSYIYGGESSTFNYFYPQAGRNFMLGINCSF